GWGGWGLPGAAAPELGGGGARAAGEQPADESTILEDVEDGPDVLRVRITSAEARAFVERARRVGSAGRPPRPASARLSRGGAAGWSGRGARPARCAGCRWTPPGTSARGRTATAARPRPDQPPPARCLHGKHGRGRLGAWTSSR